jgi:pectin methylesterase-like acyl-CoA thioesterase/lysophospholipase L1-like esterase
MLMLSLSTQKCLLVKAMLLFLAGMLFAGADYTAPPIASLKLVSIFPPAGAINICIDTPLRLTFDGPPTLSQSGTAQILDDTGTVVDAIDLSARTLSKTIGGLPNFNYYPVVINGNEAVVAFKNNILNYGKSYELRITAGLFVDKNGKAAAGLEAVKTWRFSTKPAPTLLSTKSPHRIIIAADGSGDFATVQGAIDFIPAGNTAPTAFFIRKGTYHEIIYLSNRHNLTVMGEDRQGAIIAYANNQGLNNTDNNAMPGGYRRGMFRAANCNDLTIAHLTLHNTTPQGGGQAEAIILNGGANAHAIITDVDMYSHQDTLQINGQAYVSNCYIEGDVDFMWGAGPCFFENCRLRALRNKSMYTQIRNPATNHGYIYNNCKFEGAPGVAESILSRVLQTRFPASEVVLLNCMLTDAVSPVGWRLDSPAESPYIHFWEYNSRDPQGNPIDDSKRLAASRRLTIPADAETIANYSNAAWVLGGDWNPELASVFKLQAPPSNTRIGSKPPENTAVAQHPALFLVGDSLMKTGSGTGSIGPWGYGEELIPMFDAAKIHVYNEGKGGRSSRGYIEEGLWKNLLARVEPGDWIMVQFGHNDAANSQNYPDRLSGKGSGDEMIEVNSPGGKKLVHSYGWYLQQYVKDAAGKGAKTVILSPVPRNQWADGKIIRGFDGYVQWAAEAAFASGAFYVDLNAFAADRYNALGQQAATQMFNDLQHTTKAGAKINAESVAAGLKKLKACLLATYLSP